MGSLLLLIGSFWGKWWPVFFMNNMHREKMHDNNDLTCEFIYNSLRGNHGNKFVATPVKADAYGGSQPAGIDNEFLEVS